MIKVLFSSLLIIFLISKNSYSQYENENHLRTFTSWFLFQLVPSPYYSQDTDNESSQLQFGLRWQITPFNYSWSTNEFVSPVSFFKVNPVKRFAGSMEIFFQPEWTTSSYTYTDLSRYRLSSGMRFNFPLIERGEYLYMSVGGKYSRGKNGAGDEVKDFFAAELGVYILYGALGLQYNRNFTPESKFNVGLTFRFY